ncbi:zinc finger MYND domain-containing protein 11-like [Lineus longissimus]|uniref:zinc finger MYND domain-containing protein 11-like n=1 Tax=Lineus longissimus TaxID=88925 RepID=UPI00315C584D
MKFYKRRLAPPKVVVQLWEAVNYVRQQKQIPNHERLAKFVGREHGMKPSELDDHLKEAVKDGLIHSYEIIGNKGSKVGIKQEGFKVPDLTDCNERGSHDWYCFECHNPGEVVKCKDCWRVFHADCIDHDTDEPHYYCEFCKTYKKKSKIPRRELNRLLSFTIVRLKEKTRELHRMGLKDEELKCMAFIYKDMDLNTMEEKTLAREFTHLEEFYADTRLILHNVMMCYGETNQMTELARSMVKECMYDLDEIRLCKDCYFMSNAKPKDWFCEPCSPPHDLVYAKQRGFNFWPAKVIKVTRDGYDVRFFGGWHQRATVPKSSVKPIDTNPKHITVKKTPSNLTGFTKACEELQRHKELLEKQLEKQLERKRQGITESDIDDLSDDEFANVPRLTHVGHIEDDEHEGEDMDHDQEAPDMDQEEAEDAPEMDAPERSEPEDEAAVSDPKKSRGTPQPDKVEETLPPKRRRKKRSLSIESAERESTVKKRPSKKAGIEREESESEAPVKKEKVKKEKTPRRKKKTESSGETEEENEAAAASKVTAMRMSDEQAPTPEDVNLVTSSEDKVPKVSTCHTSTQTPKKFQGAKPAAKTTQTEIDEEPSADSGKGCNCDTKYQKVVSDLKDRMKRMQEDEKEKALKELSQRLQKDFEQDKQQAVSRAITNIQRETDRQRKKTEEEVRAKYMEEMKKLAQKHKEQTSVTKKKQWCYNCEEEAMYHCCWNTSYCSITCQQEHWHKDHKRVCRRKR